MVRQVERERDRETERERELERQRDKERDTERKTEREGWRYHRMRENRDRERCIHIVRQRERE